MRYAFTKRHSSANYQVRFLCEICIVSSSGYYDWLCRKESLRARENRVLIVKIRALFEENDSTYGAIRIRRALINEGLKCSKNQVARIMRREGLVSVKQEEISSLHYKLKAPAAGGAKFNERGLLCCRTESKMGR